MPFAVNAKLKVSIICSFPCKFRINCSYLNFLQGPVIGSSLSYESDQEKHPFSPKKVQFNTKQPRHVEFTEDIPEEDLEDSSEDGGLEEVEHHVGGSEVIIEDSFQERMKKWDALEVVRNNY